MTIAWLPLVLYAAAAAAYLAHFSRRDTRTGRLATALLGGAVLAHTFLIGMQTMEAGYAPLVGTTAAVSAFVWLLGLAYLYVELTTDERAMGAFVTVLLAVLAILPALNPQIDERPALLRSPLFTVHVLSMLFAYASFALAFVLGITYVLLFKEIKAKHLGLLLRAAAVAADARRDERPGDRRRLAVPDRAGWSSAASGRRRSADRPIRARRRCRVVDPKILVRAGVLGDLLVRAVRAAGDRLERAPRRLAVGDRVRDRAAQFRAGRVLPDEEPQLLVDLTSMRLFAVGISHRTAPVELRECVDFARRGARRGAGGAGGAERHARSGGALDLQPRRDLRRRRIRRGRRVLRPLHQRIQRRGVGRARAACRHLPRARGGRPPVPRRRRPRLAGRRRAADPRAGQGRVRRGERAEIDRRAHQPAVHVGLQRRQARAQRDGPRRRRGVGQLRGDRAGEEDLRRARRAQRPDPRRRRDGEADRRRTCRRRASSSSRSRAARSNPPRRSPRALDGRAVPWSVDRPGARRRRHRRHRDRRASRC